LRSGSRDVAQMGTGPSLAVPVVMKHDRRFALPFLALCVGLGAVGCSSSENGGAPPFETPSAEQGPGDRDDPAFSTPEERAELDELEIGQDEPIVDEGDLDGAEAGTVTLLDNPVEDDEELVPDVDTSDVLPAAHPFGLPGANVGPHPITGSVFKCIDGKKNPVGRCVCGGSPLNCQLPNSQPGRNRYLPPDFVAELDRRVPAADRAGKIEGGKWEVRPHTILFEGGGGARGSFTSPCVQWSPDGAPAFVPGDPAKTCVKINFGQVKKMQADGDAVAHSYVYAFNVFVNGTVDASGWIKLGDVTRATDLRAMGSTAPRRVRTFSPTHYVVKSAKDFGLDPRTYTWTQLPSHAFAAAKISPGDGSKQVKDYLLRDGNVINLAYNTPRVGGVSTDTLAVGDHTLEFHRVKSTKKRPALIHAPTDLASRPRIIFAYGELAGRFGWLALPAFMKGNAHTPPSSDACDGRPDGGYCVVINGSSGFVCKGGKTVQAVTCPAEKPLCAGPGEDGSSVKCDG
jgi:hypothetical protein